MIILVSDTGSSPTFARPMTLMHQLAHCAMHVGRKKMPKSNKRAARLLGTQEYKFSPKYSFFHFQIVFANVIEDLFFLLYKIFNLVFKKIF